MYIGAKKSLCKIFAISEREELGRRQRLSFFSGPLADISSLCDPEREFRISKKAGLPDSSDWRRVFGGAVRMVSSPHIPVPAMASAAQTNGRTHLSAQPCSAGGMLPSS